MSDLETIEQAVKNYCRRRGYEPVHVRVQVVGGEDVSFCISPDRPVGVGVRSSPESTQEHAPAEAKEKTNEVDDVEPEDDQVETETNAPKALMAPDRAWVSADFRTLFWYGKKYHFSPKQAAMMELLWEARAEGVCDVRQEALLRAADSDSLQVRDLLKRSSAWGTVIVRGETLGTYRLASRPVAEE